MALSDKDIDRLRQQLLKRREQLRWVVHDTLLESKREDFVDLAGQVHDAAEESFADLLAGVNLAHLDREVKELADIEAALQRISAGTYGECVDCGTDIVLARLDAYPTAKRCQPCQARREDSKRGGRDATPSL
ncbi:MAG: TraR/DksA C4-type zinc finger protein [Pseudomonadota bacterium]|nr:MAG: TraR/DksA C4-type zinc finger protein [Pseudomonadota bacterium]